MKFLFSFILIFCQQADILSAQPINWSPISVPHPPANPRSLSYSENLDMTIYCGLFHQNPDHYYFAAYNGESWEVLLDSMTIAIDCATDYQDGVLVGGAQTSEGPNIHPMGYYNGNEWTYPWQFSGGNVQNLVWTNDTLFALGNFTEIDGVPVYKIAKLVGETWEPMLIHDEETFSFTLFFDIEYFEGEYYVGGNFDVGNGLRDFARLENMQLQQVGEGLSGWNTSVSNLQVYQDELYISGKIPYIEGNVGNHLVRWNGDEFLGVGDQLYYQQGVNNGNGAIGSLHSQNGYLYCTGSFHFVGASPMSGIARWDGQQWCGMWGNSFIEDETPTLYLSGFFQDQLMITRTYTYEDGNMDFFWLFEGGDEVEFCNEPVLAQSTVESLAFSLYPNPSSGQVQITSENEPIKRVELFDLQGKKLLETYPNDFNHQLGLESFPAGLYIVQIWAGDKILTGKVVKE